MGKMILECPECGKGMIADERLGDGYILTCPACGAKSEYCASDQDDSPQASISQPTVQQSTPQRRPMYSDRPTYDDLKAEMKAEMEQRAAMERKAEASRRKNVAMFFAFLLLAIGAGAYYYHQFIYTESPSVENMPSAQPTAETPNAKNDTQDVAKEDELRRKKIKEEEERHRLERKQKQEQKEKERAEQRARLAAQKEQEKRQEESYRNAQNAFAGKASYFAFSAPDGAAVDPRQMKEEGKLWAIDKSFMENGALYEIQTGERGIESVTVLSNREPPREIESIDFQQLFGKGMWAVSTGECVWFWGTGNGSWTTPAQTGTAHIYPLGDELSDIFAAITSLRTKLPDVKYRLTLKPRHGGKRFALGIFNGSDQVPLERIQNPITEKLTKDRGADILSKIKKPTAKKFKPTVILYDGTHTAKGLDGTTRIPRTFRYTGTKVRYHGDGYIYDSSDYRREQAARERWESLYAEAKRQEEKAQEVEEENRAAMREYERKMEEAQNIRISESEIDAELQKYDLLIERSKTKYP